MKWLGIVAGVVLAGVIGAAILLPRLIDWNAYRPEIAAFAERAIGRPLVIDGNIRAELFPTPQLTAGNIRVPGGANAEDIATIRWAEARFKFSDLLRGEVTLTGLALVEPNVTLSAALLDQISEEPAAAANPSAAPSLGGAEQRDAQRIEIRNGTFKFASPGLAPIMAERVSGSVETPAVGRRYSVTMTGRVRGRELELGLRFAPPRQGEAAPVALTVTDAANAGTLRVDGDWQRQGDGIGLKGGFSLSSGDVASAAAFAGLTLPPELAGVGGAARIDGGLVVDGGAAALEITDLSVNTGALSATGGASADWSARPKLGLTMRVGRLDLDAFHAVPETPRAGDGGRAAGNTGGAPATGQEAGTATAEGPDLMAWIGTLPADLALDISVAGARFRDTIVRRITLRGSVDRGTVTLEELSAQLPGGTDLSVAGFGDMTGTEPLLEGNATLRADDLRRLLNWAGLPVPDVAADRLRRFSLVSGISLRPRRLDIIDAAVELDGVTATAAAAVALRRRLGIGVRMTLDHISLDAYRPTVSAPQPAAGSESEPAAGGQTAAAADEAEDGIAALWSRFDASLDLNVGRVVVLGIPVNDVAGNLVLKDGVLTVNEMRFLDAGGVSGAFGGQVTVAGDDDAVVLAFEGKSDDLGRVTALLEGPDFVSGFLRSLGPTVIKASYQPVSDGPSIVFRAEGEDGALSLGAAPALGEQGEPAVDILSGDVDIYGVRIAGMSGRMTFPPGVYQLEKLSGTLNGGTLNLSGSLHRRDDGLRQLLITGALDDMTVDRQLADLDGPIDLAGRISIRGQGEATGSDWRAMAALNNGWLDVDGALAMRVGASRSSIVKVRQVEDVRDALRAHFAEPASLQGALVLKNGTLSAKELLLEAEDGAVMTLTGRLGMNDLTLSADLVMRENRNAPEFARLIAEGPAKAPNLKLKAAGSSED